MDFDIFTKVDQQIPKFNRDLAEGLAVSQLTRLRKLTINGNPRVGTPNEQYVNELWELAAKSFPPELKYIGYRRVSPEEEFNIVTNKRRFGKRFYDTAKSDFYLVCYKFTLHGEPLQEVPLYLPYVRMGGIININDAKFMISPVIADLGLSVAGDGIFLMMNRARLTFDKLVATMYINGRKVIPYVMWSQVYNVKVKKTIKTTLPHYMFCKFGFIGTISQFGVTPIILSKTLYNEHREQYPEEHFKICTPVGKTSGVRGRNHRVSDVVIIIPNSQWSYPVESVVAAFFYMADVFPEKIHYEDFDNPVLWRRLLGKIILGMNETEGKIINQINTHMASVDGYVDAMVTKWMDDGGYPGITTVYELFKLIISEGPRIIAEKSDNIASMYGKRYVINRYVNNDIVHGISNTFFSIQKHVTSGKELKAKDVEKIFTRHVPYGLAKLINRNHSEVKSVSTASDCLIHKVTSVTLMQTDASTSGQGPTYDQSKRLDMSISEAAGHSNQPSRDPSGRSGINMCVQTDEFYTILQNPETKVMMDEYQEMIKR